MECIRISLLILGIWPEEHKLEKDFSFLRYRYIVTLVFILFLLFIPQCANLFIVYNSLELITENLTTVNFAVLVVFSKFFIMKSKRKVLGEMLKSYARHWENVEDSEERKTMMHYANIAGKIAIGCFMLTQGAATLKNVQKIFEIIESKAKGLERIFILQSLLPPIFKVTPYYELACLGQVIGIYCLSITYSAVDCLVYILTFHVCGQFKTLQRSLMTAIDSPKYLKNSEEFKDVLGVVVRKHESLNWFAKSIEDSFNICFLIQILISTLLMCFQYFLVFRAFFHSENLPVNDIVFMIVYIVGNMLFIYIYCYMGELLVVASTGLTNTVLESKWYKLTPNNMKMLMFIVHRSRKPLKLTAGKFSVLSVATYSNVVKTAAGYMSVMLGIESKKEEAM
ncbi:odorant receptor 13a-like [Prorops nasuta]|uniref:odorant receptor 13a-like n=1 Tax=Prorops nasuta TaxID=863751 RepID=UPI0034CEE49B